MRISLYVAVIMGIGGATWLTVRFVRDTRKVLRYIRRTKETGHVKSEIRRLRREAARAKSSTWRK